MVKYMGRDPSVVDEMRTHLFSYRHDGKLWELGIKARNAEDARRRIAALTYASYDGILVATAPAAFGPLVLLATWIRNATVALMPRF
jgi:hypothetical protein